MRAESRIMTISRSEFLRSLQPLRQGYQIVIDKRGREVEIIRHAFKVVLQLRDSRPVVLGSLHLPSLEVVFDFNDADPDEIAQFWLRFDLCFRRGGG